MAEQRRRKASPTEELFKQVLSVVKGQSRRLASIEQQLVLTQNELVRHGKMIEEVNTRCMEHLGMACLPQPKDTEDGEDGDDS